MERELVGKRLSVRKDSDTSAALDVPASQPWEGPAIILVDLDAFFASVEQLDHPEWRGKPVIVGGDAGKRGVVSTCSYEARAYGVRSAMPSAQAAKLCPDAIWTRGHYHRYRELSRATMAIIRDETPLVEQVSIDEAFADISPTRINTEHPIQVARRIQRRVSGLGVTCSIGLGTTKSVAKIASDMDKPRGLTAVLPGSERGFLAPLPVRIMSGIGAAAEEKLRVEGIATLGQLAEADEALLARVFGVNAGMMRARAQGADASSVSVERAVKSVSHEVSFAKDLAARDEIEPVLTQLLTKVGRRLRLKGLAGHTLTLKVRFGDRSLHTAQAHLPQASDDDIALRPTLMALLDKVWMPGQRVRLLGVGVSGFDAGASAKQGTLFELLPDESQEGGEDADAAGLGADARMPAPDAPLVRDAGKRRRLLDAFDALKDKFGDDAVRYGGELKVEGNTTGSGSKNANDYR